MTTKAITPLRRRMIEEVNPRKLCAGTQRGHISPAASSTKARDRDKRRSGALA
jgi:hypothetical protein